MLANVWQVLAVIMIVATALPLSNGRRWWIRGLDFPRLQLSVVQFVLLALYVPLIHEPGSASLLLFGGLLAALTYQLWWILPYTELHDREVRDASAAQRRDGLHLTLLTSNVQMSNRQSDPLITLIRQQQPDIVAVPESDQWWEEQLAELSEYPYRIDCALDNYYGMHVLSRLPLEDGHVDFLVEDDIPSMHAWVTLSGQERVRFHVVHPTPPAPGENDESTERDVELLLLAKHLEDRDEPIVVTGDLNDVAWSPTTRLFRRVSGLLDLRVGRGTFNTFSAHYWWLRWPLDHFFVSRHFRVINIERLPDIGSDHFPILRHLVYTGSASEQGHLDPDAADEKLAQEILDTEAAANGKPPDLRPESTLPDPS